MRLKQQQKKTVISSVSSTPPDFDLKEIKREPSSCKEQSIDSTTISCSNTPSIAPSGVCYCDGERKLGNLEVHCSGCKRWFHQECFKDLDNFGGLPFMVSYIFQCKNCSPDKKEKWHTKNTSFSAMAIMTLANMTLEYRNKQNNNVDEFCDSNISVPLQNPFFNVVEQIIPYMDLNWEYLSTTPRRQKKTWHQTILRILQKETELFEQDPSNELAYSLRERDLFRIGPNHDCIIPLFKRNRDVVEREANALQIGGDLTDSTNRASNEGPKTRGASKRKATTAFSNASTAIANNSNGSEGSPKPGYAVSMQKKSKMAAEFATIQIEGQPPGSTIDFPFNREGYRYYLVEKDPNIPNREKFDTEEGSNTRAVQIPAHTARIVIPSTVTLSPNDRANQLQMELDNLVITGCEGYACARATHSVSHGNWYFEMEFLSQPGDSHVRVGWAQSFSVLQACVGYSKFSYGWRSKKGTIFHNGYGRHYNLGQGYRQGDVIGCLIQLPSIDDTTNQKLIPMHEMLPPSRKDCDLIKFKQNYFFEEKEESQLALQRLQPFIGSKIEFFLNGQSCGDAFTDIYFGHYFPSVSLFHSARVRMNFGPKFSRPPNCVQNGCVKPMSERAEQMQVEQALADLVYMIANSDEIESKNQEFFNAILAKDATKDQVQVQQMQQIKTEIK